jgi:hypothetical protein
MTSILNADGIFITDIFEVRRKGVRCMLYLPFPLLLVVSNGQFQIMATGLIWRNIPGHRPCKRLMYKFQFLLELNQDLSYVTSRKTI